MIGRTRQRNRGHDGLPSGEAPSCEHVEHEHPFQAIIDGAKTKGCDLIVMASHGRRGISAIVLGSETVKVLTHSTIPVLVYRGSRASPRRLD
jgi:nucleotide-binding universal stress UspA family protein